MDTIHFLDMVCSRRSFLIGSCATIASLSGCQTRGSGQRPQIGLTLRNYTDQAQPLQLSLLREDKTTSGEATVLSKEYTVPAPETDGASAGTLRKTDIVPERRYLVRVLLKNGNFERYHAHYYPAGSTAETIDIGIYRDETTEKLFVDFRSLP